MRKVLLCLVMVLFATWATVQAQEVITLTGNMEEELTPGSTYAFYDSGGPSANYGTSQSYTATFTCTGSITINFSSFATESSSGCYNWDYMLIYDGDATDGELLGRLQTGCASATITTDVDYVAQSGTLTIEWHSDGSTTAAGWEATITTEASAGPTCDKPESVEANDVTANSATINWIGTASAYNLQYKASTDADWTLVKNLSGGSYQLTNLVSNTAYQAQVQAICGENTSGWKSVSFNTLIGLPYAEHFNGTSAPSGWTIWSGQLQADGSATRTSSTVWSFGSNNGVFDNHARSNIYGTSSYKWLQLPAIPIPEMEEGDPGFQMYFNLALTKYSGTLVEVVKGSQSDDRFLVLASIDGGANWTILREWNNAGSEYVYDDIATAGEEIAPIDLSAYAGQTILLAFYGESTVSGGDNNIHVDDVIVEKIPTCLKPTGLHAVDGAATSSTLQVAWTANSGETAWRLQYKPMAEAEAEWVTLNIAANPYTITGLSAFTEYEIRVAAVCAADDETEYGKSIIAKTAAVVPFLQTFDTTTIPGEWKLYEALLEAVEESGAELVSTKNGWKAGAQNGVFGNEHLYLNIAGTDTKYWLVSPVIEMQAGYQLTFDLALTTKSGATPTAVTAGMQNDDKFIVFITTNGGADWTALGTWDNGGAGVSFDQISTEGQTVKFDLSSYAGQSIMLAFYGESTVAGGDNNLHISNVAIDLIPACERPLSITMGNITGTTAEVTWDADEEGTWEYGYAANPAADFAPAEADYTGVTTDKIADLSELAETTDYVFFVRRVCSETEKSEPLMKSFKTIQTPAALPYDGDFEEANGWLSFHGDFANEWVRGTAVAKGGTHALYISNDNGVSAAYAHGACVIYATKTFFFEEVGMYSISFDWMCNGESTWDYMRVALAPASTEVEAATSLPTGLSTTSLPEGWTALDGGSKLNLSTEWKTQRTELNVEQLGYYKVVLVWRNDGSGGTAPGGAIDNFKISKLSCRMPNGLTLGDVTANSAAFSWNDDEDGMTWEYACIPTGQEPTEFTDVDQNSLLVEGLDENTKYTFYLRKDCGDSQSEIVSLSFKTVNPYQITVNEGTATSSYVPFYAYYADSHAAGQFIIPAAQLADIQWDSIVALTFHTSSQAEHDFGDARFDVYVSEVENTTLSAMVDLTSLTKVASNKALAVEEKMMYVPFDIQYQYTGGNLLIAFNQTVAGEDKSFTWAGVSAPSGSGRYEYGTYGSAGSVSFLPKTSIDFKKGVVPPCATPKNFMALDTTATTTSIELTWTPISAETTWAVRYREQGAEDWTVVFAAADTFLLEGLNHSTIYEAQVATQCDPEDPTAIGEYSASVTFATECAAVATIEQDFEGNLLCWSVIQDSYGYPAILSNYPEDAHSGSKFGYFASQVGYDPVDEYAILPELISLENMRLKFYACNDLAEAEENATLVVGVMPAPADTANFVALDTIVLTSATYAQYVVPFTAYTGDSKYVAIKMLAATTGAVSARIDDVVVEAIPQCMEPNSLAIGTLTDNSAVLYWVPQGDEANWLVRYKKSSEEAWSEPVLTTDSALLISGLEMGISYDAQVAAWCDPTNAEAVSPYGAIISFTTLCGNITTLPWHADFENMAVNSIPTCWDNSASTSTTLNSNPERIFGVYEYGDNKMLRMYNYFVSSGTALINMPTIVLPEAPAYELSFDYAHTATCGEMTVKISVNGGDFEALTPTYGKTSTGTDKDNPGEFTTADINLTPYAGDTIVIQFFSNANYGSGAIFLDNVDIHLAPTCLKPANVTNIPANTTSNSLQIDWEPQGAEANWFVQYKKHADEEWTLVAEDVTAHPFTINGLEGATVYDIRVAAWCNPADSADASEYSNAISVVTECDALNTFPYVENFDSYEVASAYTPSTRVLPLCWSAINTCSYSTYQNYPTIYYYSTTNYAKSTPNSMRFYSYSYSSNDPQDQYAILPEMEDINTLRIKFNARAYSTSYDADFYVGVMSNPTDTATFVPVAYIELESTAYQAFDIKLNGYQGTGKYIAIKMLAATSSYRGFYMDDITVEKLPACMEPEDVVASNFTASSATISWTNGAAGQTAWQIVYSCDPEFDMANVTDEEIIDIASNPYELTGLLPDTLYTVYVRANCGETDGTSLWSSVSFRTAKSCQTPDALEASAISHNSASISWNTYGQTGFNLRYSTDGENWTVASNVETPYVISDLAAATVYRVQVQAACEGEEAWAGSFTFKTAYAAPFYEAFDATTIPADWSQAKGLMSDILDGGEFTTGSAWNFGAGSNGVFDNHARINIYGTDRKHWLMTPVIFNGGNNQLTFDLALTAFSGTGAASGTCDDDKFAVLVSTDGGETWAILREWNNSGSEYVYNNIPTAGEEIAIDLAAYAGQSILLGFYGESTVTGNGDNNLHIDNVRIDAVPTCIKPTGLTISDVYAHSATLAWTSDAAAWDIALDTIAAFNPDTLQSVFTVAENPYTLTDLLPNHTYYVYVRANCGEADGTSMWTAKQSFKTTIACPAPTGLEAQLTPGNGSIATLTWNAGEAQAWQVEYSLNSNMSDSIALVVTEPVANLTGLTAESTYYARVKADCGDLDGVSAYSAIISFLPTDIYSIVVNDGTNTNSYVPIYGTYVDEGNTASQFIVPAADLQEILWDSITSLTFYSSTPSVDWGAAEFEVYMTTTEDATLAALADWNDLTQVMVAGNLSIQNSKMVVTLSEPFQYTGDNLLIGFKQTVAGSWVTTSWYGKNTSGASIGGYGSGNNMTQRNFLPKMTIGYVPGQAPACMWATHLTVSDITTNGATFAWDAVEGANWEYALVLAGEEPVAFSAAASNPMVLDNLFENTAYVFYLRNNCGEENSKLVSIAFSTIEDIELLPYSTSFDNANGWKLANDANAWVINNGQLYVSNDGTSYAYDEEAASVSYATKLFNFEKTGTYTVSYDWKCEGEFNEEDGAIDYMRVALVPAAVELTAGVAPQGLTATNLPAGWIALDENAALVAQAEWQHVSVIVPVSGQYRLAVIWINDDSFTDGDPAAIDNLSIVHKDYPTGIEGADSDSTKAYKFIRDNHVYILLNGTVYDLTGRKVEVK